MLAKEACNNTTVDLDLGVPLARIRHILVSSNKEDLCDLRNSQRPESCSVKPYDQYMSERFIYGSHKTRTRHSNSKNKTRISVYLTG